MARENSVLISLKTFSGQGTSAIRETLTRLSEDFSIGAISSVYKVNRVAESLEGLRDIRKEERMEGLALVLRATTRLEPTRALEKMLAVESSMQKEVLKRTVSMNLLTYANEIVMLPGLVLPHPEMHLRPEEIVPAVEVWPDYVHPVLKETLLKLSRRFASEEWGEFLTQGSRLLGESDLGIGAKP